MKKMWNSFKIAFSMYSKIPMPQSEWTDENMSLAMCFFPWVGAVIGLASWVVYQAGGWLADRQETLSSGILGSSNLFLTILLVLIPIFITGGIPQTTLITLFASFASSVQMRPVVSRTSLRNGSIGTIPYPISSVTKIKSGFFSFNCFASSEISSPSESNRSIYL